MRPCRAVVVILGLLGLGGGFLSGNEAARAGEKGLNYFPLAPGNTWHYRADVNGTPVDYVLKVVKLEKGLALVEGLRDGKPIASEHLTQTEKGVFRNKVNGLPIEPPLALLPYPLNLKDKWGSRVTIGGAPFTYTAQARAEKIMVDKEEHQAIRVEIGMTDSGNRAKTTYWFAPDIGIVRQTIEQGPTITRLLLEKHELK